jgi:hypothetical protein
MAKSQINSENNHGGTENTKKQGEKFRVLGILDTEYRMLTLPDNCLFFP